FGWLNIASSIYKCPGDKAVDMPRGKKGRFTGILGGGSAGREIIAGRRMGREERMTGFQCGVRNEKLVPSELREGSGDSLLRLLNNAQVAGTHVATLLPVRTGVAALGTEAGGVFQPV